MRGADIWMGQVWSPIMSFWSNAVCYYPGFPPRVTCTQLAKFLDEIDRVGLDTRSTLPTIAMFGEPIERDDLGLREETLTEYGGVISAQSHDRAYDLKFKSRTSLTEVAAVFRSQGETPIYRCFLSLGDLPKDSIERLYIRSSVNESAICPHTLALSIEPVEIGTLRTGESWLVSYFGLTVGGPGYCFPRSVGQVVNAIRNDPAVSPITEILARIWPTRPGEFGPLCERHKEICGEDWPYMDGNPQAPSWIWAMSETG